MPPVPVTLSEFAIAPSKVETADPTTISLPAIRKLPFVTSPAIDPFRGGRRSRLPPRQCRCCLPTREGRHADDADAKANRGGRPRLVMPTERVGTLLPT
jgi:hypothetical protein